MQTFDLNQIVARVPSAIPGFWENLFAPFERINFKSDDWKLSVPSDFHPTDLASTRSSPILKSWMNKAQSGGEYRVHVVGFSEAVLDRIDSGALVSRLEGLFFETSEQIQSGYLPCPAMREKLNGVLNPTHLIWMRGTDNKDVLAFSYRDSDRRRALFIVVEAAGDQALRQEASEMLLSLSRRLVVFADSTTWNGQYRSPEGYT